MPFYAVPFSSSLIESLHIVMQSRITRQAGQHLIKDKGDAMNAPKFVVGDRVKYLGPWSTQAPPTIGGEPPDVLLEPGMAGVVTQLFQMEKEPVSGKTPVCRVRFDNGFERTLYVHNLDRFEKL
jgi:hypothetical protein